MDVSPWSLVLQMEVHSHKSEMLLSHELIYKAYVAGIVSVLTQESPIEV